jgi:hypothetical protein
MGVTVKSSHSLKVFDSFRELAAGAYSNDPTIRESAEIHKFALETVLIEPELSFGEGPALLHYFTGAVIRHSRTASGGQKCRGQEN